MRNFFSLAALLSMAWLVCAAPGAYAADPAAASAKPSIAVLNIQEIMRDSSAAKSIKTQMDKKQKSFQDELSAKETQLQKEDQELVKQRAVLSADAFQKKLEEFRTKATGAQKEMRMKKDNIDRAFARSINEIQKAVTSILEQMAKERGYSIVIPTQQILYSDPSLDITPEVLKRLNGSLPNVSVNFSESAGKK